MSKYRRNNPIVEVYQYAVDSEEPKWYKESKKFGIIKNCESECACCVYTPKGKRYVFPGDYIVHNSDGELECYKPEKFELEFEKIE